MKLKKAIVKSTGSYVSILSLLTVLSIIYSGISIGILLLVIDIILILTPPIFVIVTSKHKNILASVVLFILFLLGIFAVSFRKLRDIMPDPAISKEASIGYAQYFGYPLYLDTIIFFILILSPVLFFTLIKLVQKLKFPIRKNE